MKRANSIEQYNEDFRKRFLENWESEAKVCRAWLAGYRDWRVGYLNHLYNKPTDEQIREKLKIAESMLKNVDYYVQSHSYSYKKPQRQKDNDCSFIGEGESWAHSSQIRVPKLKRKSAWKRFYRMFPGLKGMETITGSSSCWYRDEKGEYRRGPWHYSTIKLKKTKK